MGITINLFSDGVCSAPNPNPRKFKVTQVIEGAKYDILRVFYYGCTTFNGIKIVVVRKGADYSVELDPHFFEGGNVIARFEPTIEGIDLAKSVVI